MSSIHWRSRRAIASFAVCGTLALLAAVPAVSAASVYPAGGSAFNADAEGWAATEASCSIALAGLCSASGGHDSEAGNPAGSLAAEANITLNLGGLFESTVVLESPDFTVDGDGPALIRLDRQFEPGGLLALAPEATYTVALIDRGTETPTEAFGETLDEGDSSFAGEEASASVIAGHTYALSIEVDIGSTAASLGLLGNAAARFDNIALTTDDASEEGGGDEGGGGGGSGGSSSGGSSVSQALGASELRTLVRRGDAASAGLSGKHVFVRVRCPRRAGSACRITAQGRIKQRVPVTQRRTVRVAKGRSRLIALRVKRRFREKVAKRKRLLVVQKVRVGKVTVTYARSRALIQRR
jgi:hypothetical protein